MSSHGPTHRAFAVTHQRITLDINLNGQIRALTEIVIVPLDNKLQTVHLHSTSTKIISVSHPAQPTPSKLKFNLNEPKPVSIPDPRSVKQFPEAKRRLFQRVNEKGTGELAIGIDRSKIKKIDRQPSGSTPSATLTAHQSQKEKEEYEPISIEIEYCISSEDLKHNLGICVVEGPYPHVFTNSISPRSWIPCVDSLWERCTWELELIVPKSVSTTEHPITVIASGELIEQVLHPSDPSKTIFHYSQSIPTSVQHIAWAVGPFIVSDLTPNHSSLNGSPVNDQDQEEVENQQAEKFVENDSCNQIKLHAFSLPNRTAELHHTSDFMLDTLTFFTQEYGSYPYSSYKLVFLDMFSATHSIGATFNSATLTLYPSDLLYPSDIIDQVYETKSLLVHSLASQWVGVNIIPKSPSDTWLINGLSLYITAMYLKRVWGLNEYRFRLKKDMMKCVQLDVNKPPICQLGLPDAVDTEVLGFVNLKGSLVLYILDRHLRRSGGGTSLGLSRVIPKIFLSAISGEMRDSRLSTNNFLRTCRKLSGNDMKAWAEQWIYSSGCPIFEVVTQFNRKKMVIELTMKQINRAKSHYDNENTSWEERCNLKPLDHFEGQMSIRIHEADGIPYEHVLDVKDHSRKYELPINTKYKRARKSIKRYTMTNPTAEAEEEADDRFTWKLWDHSKEERARWRVEDWTEDEDQMMMQSMFEWIRFDVEAEWICDFRFEMKEYMWIEQLQRDKDVVAQLEAIEALKQLPSNVVSSHLCKTVLTPEYFFRIRIEAVYGLVSCATRQCNYLGLFHLLKLFQTRYCFAPQKESADPFEIRAIPKTNHFGNLIEYFLRKAIVVALSRVRDHSNTSPVVCQQFFLDQLTYNDNSMNPYSDVNYVSTVISAMTDCFMHSAEGPSLDNGSELFGMSLKQQSHDGSLARRNLWAMINEVERCLVMDRLVPSYRNLVTMAVIESKLKMMLASLMPVDIMFFLACTRPGNYPPIRILAFDCLLLLRAFQEKAIVRYMFLVMRDDECLLVKRRLAMGLVQCLPILVLMEELAVEPKKGGYSIIDDPTEVAAKTKAKFDHKNVTKLLRAEVGRALILRDCIVSVMLDPNVDLDVQTCLIKISEVLFKPSDESVPPKALVISTNVEPSVEISTPTLPKIKIAAPSSAIDQMPIEKLNSPRIVIKDRSHLMGEPEIVVQSGGPTSRTTAPEIPQKLVDMVNKPKPKPAPKPKKFQASGMTIPDHKLCQSILKKLVSNPLGAPFRKPVDPIRQNAPDYFNIISRPMDFKTMSDKLEMGQYPDRQAFRDDFNLVIQNCKTYNLNDSPLVLKHAEPMKVMFDKQWERSEKTMSAVQAKGIGGAGAGWIKSMDSKPILASSIAPPLAPPPSFAAFAAGGSMISASPTVPSPQAPSNVSPEMTRPSGLKVVLKPTRSTNPSGSQLATPAQDSPTMPPPTSKTSLKLKVSSSVGRSPSTPTLRIPSAFPKGHSGSLPTFVLPPPPTFPIVAPNFPAPPPPSISEVLPSSTVQPPALPTFPAPPPPTLDSLNVSSQPLQPVEAPASTPKSKISKTTSSAAVVDSAVQPMTVKQPTTAPIPSPSLSQTPLSTPSSQSGRRKTTITAKLSKPAPASISSTAGPSGSAPQTHPPVPPPIGSTEPQPIPHSRSASVTSISPIVTRPTSTTGPIKIKVVKKPAHPINTQRNPSDNTMISSTPSSAVKKLKVSPDLQSDKVVGINSQASSVRHSQSPLIDSKSTSLNTPTLTMSPNLIGESKKTKLKKPNMNVDASRNSEIKRNDSISSSLPTSGSSSSRLNEKNTTPTKNEVNMMKKSKEEGSSRASVISPDLISIKKAKVIIKAMLDHPSGVWFRVPVDPIKDGAPTYLDEIECPMDLSTMMKKLESHQYEVQSELMNDFSLMVSNAIKFNGSESFVGLDAKRLEGVWWDEWEKASRINAKEKRALSGLIQKLLQVPGANIFSEPVDPILLQIPEYYEIIGGKEKARDLGTIRKKLNSDGYLNISEIEFDLRLMLINCFKFNPKDTPVEMIGRDLEKVLEIGMNKFKKEMGIEMGSANGSGNSGNSGSGVGNKRKGNEGGLSSKKSKLR
ncbi:hypothetical protein DFH28DRAFT_1103158 [Melampsora americana]|nr:hypothetical protein DFH28DRAFT_1103158 [Melampsora americana]